MVSPGAGVGGEIALMNMGIRTKRIRGLIKSNETGFIALHINILRIL